MKETRTVTIDPGQHKLLREYSQRDGKTAEETPILGAGSFHRFFRRQKSG